MNVVTLLQCWWRNDVETCDVVGSVVAVGGSSGGGGGSISTLWLKIFVILSKVMQPVHFIGWIIVELCDYCLDGFVHQRI